MFCTKCGKEIKEDDQFCYYCGSPVSGKQKYNYRNNYQDPHGPMDQGRYDNPHLLDRRHAEQSVGPFLKRAEAWFETNQDKLQAKLGSADPLPETHAYQKLGGWLAVFTYGWALSGIICLIMMIVSLVSMLSARSVWGGISPMITNPILIFVLLLYGLESFLCFYMFLLVQKKDTGFVRFYEIIGLISLGSMILIGIFFSIYFRISMGNYAGYAVLSLWTSILPSFFGTVIGLALMLLYFAKSVRVRTYFGTDEYFRKSIFLKRIVPPEPAVPDRMPQGDCL